MRTTKILLSLLLSMTFLSAYAGKPKKPDPLLTGPFYIQPYFQAFGMNPEALDDSPASQGCVDVYTHQRKRGFYFVAKRHAETSIDYDAGDSGFLVDHIFFNVYREYPTLEETEGFFWNEIPKDWEEISAEAYEAHTKKRPSVMTGVCSPIYHNMSKCYRLPKIEGRPMIYASAAASAYPMKKRFSVVATIDFYEEGGESPK